MNSFFHWCVAGSNPKHSKFQSPPPRRRENANPTPWQISRLCHEFRALYNHPLESSPPSEPEVGYATHRAQHPGILRARARRSSCCYGIVAIWIVSACSIVTMQ